MSAILLKINFKDKTLITKKILYKICKDILRIILNNKYFTKKENIFINYNIDKKINKKLNL